LGADAGRELSGLLRRLPSLDARLHPEPRAAERPGAGRPRGDVVLGARFLVAERLQRRLFDRRQVGVQ
jgi:hypothetical protein